MNMSIVRSVINEYGIPWAVNRSLYSLKLKMLRVIPASEQLFEHKKAKVKRLGIFEINTVSMGKFLGALHEEQKAELIDTADKACEGRILGFSSLYLDYGNPINWQFNPLTGKTYDISDKWYKIPDFDSERGDIKVIWEASRFTHFYLFVKAFLLTGDAKYYQAFCQQLDNWLRNNPYSYGVNYKCGQECALRMINGLMAYMVFYNLGVTTKEDEKNIKELVSRCYKKILSNFFYAYRCIKNNHTISELAGMIIGAWCCEDETQIEKAYNMLNKTICSQFSVDGGYTQCSFNYQRVVLQVIECVISISGKTGHRLNQESLDRVLKSSLLLYQCQNDDGDMPNYGSNDGALIFPVTSCGYSDYRPVINCVHALTKGNRCYEAGIYDEELLWFAESIDKYPVKIEPRVACEFPDAGLYCLRSADSHMMIVLNDYRSRPAHMDQMHIDLWINGLNVFCDSGTFSYTSEIRKNLVATAAHNTVKIDDIDQMNAHGAFMLCDWTKRKNVEWVDGLFKGTMVSENGYEHMRTVETLADGYRITDKVKMKEDTSFNILFHTPCDADVTKSGIQLSHKGKLVCSMMSEDGVIEISEVERSLYYLKSEKIRCIHISCKNNKGILENTIIIKFYEGKKYR